eukprot:COSAG01_NODE_7763_length_3066_cov_35.319852_1_plen_132_part_00
MSAAARQPAAGRSVSRQNSHSTRAPRTRTSATTSRHLHLMPRGPGNDRPLLRLCLPGWLHWLHVLAATLAAEIEGPAARKDSASIWHKHPWCGESQFFIYLLRAISLSACFGHVTSNNNIGYISNVYRYTL